MGLDLRSRGTPNGRPVKGRRTTGTETFLLLRDNGAGTRQGGVGALFGDAPSRSGLGGSLFGGRMPGAGEKFHED